VPIVHLRRRSKIARFKVHWRRARSFGILAVGTDVWFRSPGLLSAALEATLGGIMPGESQRTRRGNRWLARRK